MSAPRRQSSRPGTHPYRIHRITQLRRRIIGSRPGQPAVELLALALAVEASRVTESAEPARPVSTTAKTAPAPAPVPAVIAAGVAALLAAASGVVLADLPTRPPARTPPPPPPPTPPRGRTAPSSSTRTASSAATTSCSASRTSTRPRPSRSATARWASPPGPRTGSPPSSTGPTRCPTRKSPGQVNIPGLSVISHASDFTGRLDLTDGVLEESGGGESMKAWVAAAKDELIVDVTGANPNVDPDRVDQPVVRPQPRPRRSSGTAGTLAETWVDNSGYGASGQTFGSLAAITAGGRDVTGLRRQPDQDPGLASSRTPTATSASSSPRPTGPAGRRPTPRPSPRPR